jgi:hypothetical protein
MKKTKEIRGMIDRRRFMTLLGLLAGPLLGGPAAVAQPIVIDHEYEYKAAYLYHFALLCTWPPAEENDPIVVGVLGPDRFGRQLQRIERQSENRVVTRVFGSIDQYEPCHILFVSGGPGGTERLQQALENTARQATLVFTEVEDGNFARDGVAVNFYIENNRLKLRINLDAADAAGVTIPERLQRLNNVTIHPRRQR